LGGSRLRPVAGSIFLVRIRNSHNSHEDIGLGTIIREVWVGSGADRQWNRGAASRIREVSGQPHPPKPPVLGRIKFGRSSPRASCARFLSNRRGGVPVRKDQPLGLLEGCSPARSAGLASSRHWRASSLKYFFSSCQGELRPSVRIARPFVCNARFHCHPLSVSSSTPRSERPGEAKGCAATAGIAFPLRFFSGPVPQSAFRAARTVRWVSIVGMTLAG
jgi:hypothetical protein